MTKELSCARLALWVCLFSAQGSAQGSAPGSAQGSVQAEEEQASAGSVGARSARAGASGEAARAALGEARGLAAAARRQVGPARSRALELAATAYDRCVARVAATPAG
ncbi:MAG: hypothetical protein ACON4Z_16680, partial [Planctomycetota bacterium]